MLDGTDFDVYYEASDDYSATIAGNTVNFRLNAFTNNQVDILQQLQFMGVVAHGGKSIKSRYTQQFNGAYSLGDDGNSHDAAYASLTSTLGQAHFNGGNFNQIKTVAAAEDVMLISRDGNPA